MKTTTKNALLMALLFITACKKEVANKSTGAGADLSDKSMSSLAASSGSATFTRFISIGDSQTAGYANDGLYNAGIQNSYPNLIASRLAEAGLPSFNQPLFGAAQLNGTGALKLVGVTPDGFPITTRETTQLGIRGSIAIPGFGTVPLLTKYAGLNDNFGIVGLRVADISNPAVGNVNSYLERLLPANSPANTATYIDYATASPFSFFSLNLGSNDVLGFALQGGTDVSQITDRTAFNTQYEALVTRLTKDGAKGVVTNIPDVYTVPYFNVLKVNDLVAKVHAVNPAVTALYINARSSAVTTNTAYAVRAATSSDLLVLTFDATKIGKSVSTPAGPQPYGLSPLAPIENKWVLDANEAQITAQYITAYNASIKSIAAAHSLAFVDVFAYFRSIKSGAVVQGINVSGQYLTGGLFSLDGVHLTPRGNALVANLNIGAINKQYGSTIRTTLLANYSPN